MARQVRSEVTRRKILDAAIDVFSEVGYAAAGWGTIIERTGMTKGALYHHFDSKEALASDIIDEGSDILLGAFRNVCGSASPASGKHDPRHLRDRQRAQHGQDGPCGRAADRGPEWIQ